MVSDPTQKQKWEQWIIRIEMDNRPSTNPIKRDGSEGYPTYITAIRKTRGTVASKEKIDLENNHTDWRLVGSPNEFLWWFPAGILTAGCVIPADAKWVKVLGGGGLVYRYEMFMDFTRISNANGQPLAPAEPTHEQIAEYLRKNGLVATPVKEAEDIAAKLDELEVDETKAKRGRKPKETTENNEN